MGDRVVSFLVMKCINAAGRIGGTCPNGKIHNEGDRRGASLYPTTKRWQYFCLLHKNQNKTITFYEKNLFMRCGTAVYAVA